MRFNLLRFEHGGVRFVDFSLQREGKEKKSHDHQLHRFSDFFEFKFYYINLYNLQVKDVKEPSPPECRCPSKL